MNANELRLGNYLLCERDNALLVVAAIFDESSTIITKVVDRSKFPLAEGWNAGPIQLTEEWLKKLGFKKDKYEKNVWGKNDFDIVFGRGYNETGPHWHYAIDFEKGTGYTPLWRAIDYVHQLQNLFFAFTGEELAEKEEQ